jgi:hypothetical protein
MFRKIFVRILSVIVLFTLVISTYLLLARPHQLSWGATKEEINRPMPGDKLDTQPTFLSTRAITIKGTPHEIWP